MKHSMAFFSVAVIAALVGAAACENAPGTQTDVARLEGKKRGAAEEMRSKKGFVQNIDMLTMENQDFRRVVYTGRHIQLVLMSLPPGEHIGMEEHDVDQFFRIEDGAGEVVINGARHPFERDFAIIVPAGATHDVINTGASALKVYTLYAPPQHRDGVVHRTRADAEQDEEKYEGKTTE